MTDSASDITLIGALKDELLRIPITAYSKAVQKAQEAHLEGNDSLADLYNQIAIQLGQEGYSPDPETGQPGPATKSYYTRSVLGD